MKEQLFAQFLEYWDEQTSLISGGDPYPIEWPNVLYQESKTLKNASAWCRVAVNHATSKHTAFNRITYYGVVTIQVFTPSGIGVSNSEEVSNVPKEFFISTVNILGCRFRNVVVSEIGIDKPWYQVNVYANFEYDEITEEL